MEEKHIIEEKHVLEEDKLYDEQYVAKLLAEILNSCPDRIVLGIPVFAELSNSEEQKSIPTKNQSLPKE